MEINLIDIITETYNTSNSGWVYNQSGVRLTHIPTMITVSCGEERSAHANRWKALRMLGVAIRTQTDLTKQMHLDF